MLLYIGWKDLATMYIFSSFVKFYCTDSMFCTSEFLLFNIDCLQPIFYRTLISLVGPHGAYGTATSPNCLAVTLLFCCWYIENILINLKQITELIMFPQNNAHLLIKCYVVSKPDVTEKG